MSHAASLPTAATIRRSTGSNRAGLFHLLEETVHCLSGSGADVVGQAPTGDGGTDARRGALAQPPTAAAADWRGGRRIARRTPV